MKRMGKLSWLPLVLLLIIIPITSPPARTATGHPEADEAILVGRISHVEGELLRYVPEEEDWAAAVKDAPFGIVDALYSEKDGRAEIMMPNNTWVRIGTDTQIQLIELKDDVTEIDVASGVARFYNKSADGTAKATTPFGYVTAPGQTSFDLYVGDSSVEVISLKGTVHFVHNRSETRYAVIASSSSILADSRTVTAGEIHVAPDWDGWNRKRDILWAKRARTSGESLRHLPPRLDDEAYVFEEHGRWERVYYDGAYHYFWRPVHVSVGWAPFTVGRWTVWYGDHTWIPREPFGYVTHHYGAWVFAGGFWYWAPPMRRVRIHLPPPPFFIPWAWYPGRVAWIHFGVHVGWVPLAPHEPYYCHHRWGPRTVAVNNVNITNVHIHINKYRNYKHAVILNRNNLYRVANYRNAGIRKIGNPTIIRNYRVARVVNGTVVKDYKNIRNRYNFKNAHIKRKPDPKIVSRIQRNQLVANQKADVKAKRIRKDVASTKRSGVARRVQTKTPKAKHKVSSGAQDSGRVSQARIGERDTKRKARSRAEDRKQARREVQSKKQRIPPTPMRREETKQGKQRQARGETRKGHRRMPTRPDSKVQGVEGQKKARHDRQVQQSLPVQQHKRRKGGSESKIRGGSSRQSYPISSGATRSRARHDPGKDRILSKDLKSSGKFLPRNNGAPHRKRAHNRK